MKYRLRKISIKTIGVLLLMILPLCLITTSFFMLKNASIDDDSYKQEVKWKKVKKSKKIDAFIESIPEGNFIEENDINKEIVSILEKEEDKYNAHIFQYASGEELSIEDVIKPDQLEVFKEKIKELLYLKYPAFIVDVLLTNSGRNEYYLKENELIIYYYDYAITPMVTEDLFLTVNYNEIKDDLTFAATLDATYQNEDGSIIDANKKLISITFDDGPSGFTKELVDILTSNKASATFFMVTQQINKYNDSVKYVDSHGNEIGYHSYEHKNFKRQSIEEIQNEFQMSNTLLQSLIGKSFSLTRPPYGAINDEVKSSLDTSFILWNLDTEDWRHKDVNYLYNYVLENVKDGDIILFHDMYRSSIDTVKALLPVLYTQGYQVVTVSDLAKSRNKVIDKHSSYRFFTK